jgi:hypothetical protein
MSTSEQERRPPTEEELRAAYEAEIKKIRVDQVLLEHVVSLVNLGMRRTGLSPGTEDERDVGQVQMAIDAIRAQLPLLERTAGDKVRPIRDALSQLQLAFVKIGGSQPEASSPEEPGPPQQPPPPKAGEAGPAQRSGKLWVPGQ